MKILVAIDFSDAFDKVVKQAEVLARALSAKITLLHVTDPDPGPSFTAFEPDLMIGGIEPDPQVIRNSLAKRYQQEHKRLQEVSQWLREEGIGCVAVLVQGNSADTILAEAEKQAVDMILLGSHGKGVAAKLLLGSTSEGVLRKSKVPVHIVPTRPQ